MDLFFEPHRELLAALLEHKVNFIVIGGYAVNYHGFNRPTGDMDLWLNPTEENKQRFLSVLKSYDFDDESIAYVQSLDFTQEKVFSMGEVPVSIDFLTKVSGLKFEDADKEKVFAEIEDMKIPILHLNHLVLSKMGTDRLKDKLDIEELQKIAQLKNPTK